MKSSLYTFEGYGSPHDSLKGHTYGSLEPSGRSHTFPIYTVIPEEYEELDDYVDELPDNDVQIGIERKLGMNYLGGTDASKNHSASSLVGNNAILEWQDENMPQSRNGMAPFTHRQLYPNGMGLPIGTGGSDQAFKSTGNYRYKGTEKGSSRPHKLMTDIEDDNIYHLEDLTDPMERSWRRQQHAVHAVLNYINECMLG